MTGALLDALEQRMPQRVKTVRSLLRMKVSKTAKHPSEMFPSSFRFRLRESNTVAVLDQAQGGCKSEGDLQSLQPGAHPVEDFDGPPPSDVS